MRHPSFEDAVADCQARQGMPALQGDDVHYARVLALGNGRVRGSGYTDRPPALCL